MADLDLGTLKGHVDLDVDQFTRKYSSVVGLVNRLASTPIPDLKVDADTVGAQADIDKVSAAVASLPDGVVNVAADAAAALGDLSKVDAAVGALPDGDIAVTADTSAAEGSLNRVADVASAAGGTAGRNMAGKIVAALATIPVAGAVVGIGAAIGDALLDGLQAEVRTDLFSARTGLDEATAGRFARAAGEAYANNFGASIGDNMDAARQAVQSGLLDPQATARDAQEVIEHLTGVADLMGEEFPAVARAAAQAIRTGLAGDGVQAMDLLARGTQAGLNVSEDLLDTLNEYGTQFRKVGLDGPQSFGLLAQAVRAGARDTDVAADALKEFSIRAVDGSELTATSFEAIGLSAERMSDRIAAGGPQAAAALDETLDRLRAIEDPATRAQVAVGLFGTQAEDLGDALYAMDLSSAVAELGAVEGAARSALDTMGDNAAGDIETARRNIEVAADGIQAALAQAFNPQISGASTFVTENREAVMQFLLDASNQALDLGRSLLEAAAAGTEGFGDFVGEVGPAVLDLIESILVGIDSIPTIDMSDAIEQFRDMRGEAESSFAEFDVSSSEAAESIRRNLIENGLDPAQAKLNEVGIPMVAQAAFHDVSLALAADLDGVGYAADGSRIAVALLNGTVDTSTTAGRLLDEQLRGVVVGLDEQARAGRNAGESQDTLRAKYDEGRVALILQLEQMGYTRAEAENLAAAYGAIPGRVETIIVADVDTAQSRIDAFMERNRNRKITVQVEATANSSAVYMTPSGIRMEGRGDILQYMADGGINAEPLDRRVAAMVPPGRLRVMVGDRPDVDELFAPLDGSPRSHALMAEGARRMGAEYLPMDEGALLTVRAAAVPTAPQVVAGPTYHITVTNTAGQPLTGQSVVNALKAHDALRGPTR